MLNYEITDILSLEHFTLNCLYAFCCFQKHQEEVVNSFIKDGVPPPGAVPGEVIRVNFYIETFHNNLSEMYSFFERKDDREILDQLKFNEAQRKAHRSIRHGLAHFGKEGKPNPHDAMKMKMELAKQAGLDNEVTDFLTMVRYSKKMLNEPISYEEMKKDINMRILAVLKLFEGAKINKKFLDDLLG